MELFQSLMAVEINEIAFFVEGVGCARALGSMKWLYRLQRDNTHPLAWMSVVQGL